MSSLSCHAVCFSNYDCVKNIFDWVGSSSEKLMPLFKQDKQEEAVSGYVRSCLEEMLFKTRLQQEVIRSIGEELANRKEKFGAPLSESCKVLIELAKESKLAIDTLDLSRIELVSSDGKSSSISELQEIAELLPHIKKIRLNRTALARDPSKIVKALSSFKEVYELHLSYNQLIFSMDAPPYNNPNTIYIPDLMQMKSLKKIMILDSYISSSDKKEALKQYPELEILDDESL